METSRFEHVCQQIFSGECSPLLEILPVDALINVMSNEVRNDADLFAALHALQMDPQYRASPEQRRVLKLNHRNIETERGRMRLQYCEEVIADLYNSHFVKVTLPTSLYD